MNRPLQASDLPEVKRISSAVFMGDRWQAEQLELEMKHGKSLAKFIGEKLISFVFYRELDEAIEINWLVTNPDFTRLGHMQSLLKQLFDAQRHIKKVWLEVHDKNESAIQFYLKLGFKQSGERKKYYPDGGNALVMTLDLCFPG